MQNEKNPVTKGKVRPKLLKGSLPIYKFIYPTIRHFKKLIASCVLLLFTILLSSHLKNESNLFYGSNRLKSLFGTKYKYKNSNFSFFRQQLTLAPKDHQYINVYLS